MPKKISIAEYLRSSISRDKVAYGLSFVLSGASIVNNIAGPFFFAKMLSILDEEEEAGKAEKALPWLLLYTGSVAGGKFINLLKNEALTPASTAMSHELTDDVVNAYFNSSMEQSMSSAGSPAIHHFGISYEQIGRSFVDGLYGKLIPSTIELIVAMGYVSYQYGSYGAVVGGSTAAHLLFLGLGSKIVSEAQNAYVKGLFEGYEHIISQIIQYSNVHYFGAVNRELNKLSKALNKLDNSLDQSILVRNRALFLQADLINALALMLLSYLYVHDPFEEKINRRDFVWLLLYTMQIAPTFYKLGESANKLVADYGSFKDLIKYVSAGQLDPRLQKLLNLTPESASVAFENVSFSYSTGVPVLNNVSFSVAAGKTLVITGISGAGKSSILKILQGFYKPTSGNVKIGGKNISDVNLESLRKNLAIVPQSPTLQNTSIYENIKYANPAATDEQIRAAASKAGLDDLIKTKGFDFQVGANGAKLSGGERQRIAIARGHLRLESEVLVLDEVTASLDMKTERVILSELAKLLNEKPRTTIVVTHRLSTINILPNIDNVLVLDQGQIVESGTVNELIAKGGLFASQMAIAQEEELLYKKAVQENLVAPALDNLKVAAKEKANEKFSRLHTTTGEKSSKLQYH